MDRRAIEKLGVPGYELMCRAGQSAFQVLRRRWPAARHVLVVCGYGNNGGDGYVLARLARRAGLEVTTVGVDVASLRGDALIAYKEFEAEGGAVLPWSRDWVAQAEVIVDALFGIGLTRDLQMPLDGYVSEMNASGRPILAIDIPSGLHAETGRALGEAIRATCTVTFIGLKLGFYVGVGADHVGDIEFDSLGIEASSSESVANRIDEHWLRAQLPSRSRLSHKGSNGHVLVIGGGPSMAGAVRMTAEACLRVGAGLVTVATCAQNVSTIVVERPELIVRAVSNGAELRSLLDRADVVVVGPGLGQDEWAKSLVDEAFIVERRLVVDADALNLLAQSPRRSDSWILTPHPGEAARLLSTTNAEIQMDRMSAAKALQEKFGGVIVLKGANTVIRNARALPALCDEGNPAMATPGMGDVLAGVIAGMWAQLDDAFLSGRVGVVAHAVAGDRAAKRLGGIERGLIASDLFAELPACVST